MAFVGPSVVSFTAKVVWSFPQHIMLFLRTSYRKQLNALDAHFMCRKYFPHFKLQQTVHRIYSNLLAMSKQLFWSITSVEQQEFFFILDSLKNKSLYNPQAVVFVFSSQLNEAPGVEYRRGDFLDANICNQNI